MMFKAWIAAVALRSASDTLLLRPISSPPVRCNYR
jgi:hypothetical protein